MNGNGIWYHKHRPKTLDDYVWKDQGLRKIVERWIEEPLNMGNLILAGPWGTGKTTLALMFQELLNLETTDFLFINSGLKGGIETIRQDIVNHCESAGWGGIKIVVLDEADNLSHAAQESLKGVMDQYAEYTRFVFTTNRLTRISGGLQSRCTVVTIEQMNQDEFTDRIVQIAQEEGVFTEESTDEEALAIQEIIERTYPDMRSAIKLLQHSVVDGRVVMPLDEELTGADWIESVVDTIQGKGTLDGLRQLLAGIRKDELEDVYRFLYENVTELTDHPHDAVVQIAEYLDRHSRSAFPDVTLAALLLELQEL